MIAVDRCCVVKVDLVSILRSSENDIEPLANEEVVVLASLSLDRKYPLLLLNLLLPVSVLVIVIVW